MRWMGVSNSRATGECKVPFHLKNQEAPFLIEAIRSAIELSPYAIIGVSSDAWSFL